MMNKVHLLAAVTATVCITAFFNATIFAELFGSRETIAIVKHYIVSPGLFLLIPAIAVTGASGFALSKSRSSRFVINKKKRMPFIAANGLFILVPTAIILDQWASTGSFGLNFYVFQAVELTAGAANLTLMFLNIRDGLKITGKLRSQRKAVVGPG